MATRLSVSVLQNLFAICWFSLNMHKYKYVFNTNIYRERYPKVRCLLEVRRLLEEVRNCILSRSVNSEKFLKTALHHSLTSFVLEPAKCRDLRAKNVLVCQRVLRPRVSTCFTCLRANVSCVLMFSRTLRAHMPTLARKHARDFGRIARKHAKHMGMQFSRLFVFKQSGLNHTCFGILSG